MAAHLCVGIKPFLNVFHVKDRLMAAPLVAEGPAGAYASRPRTCAVSPVGLLPKWRLNSRLNCDRLE